MNELDGFYAGYVSGLDGQGFVMFALLDGQLIGADPLGVTFDGKCKLNNAQDALEGRVLLKAPPNVALIQGVNSGPSGMTYEIDVRIPVRYEDSPFIEMATPLGPLNMKLKKLRGAKPE